MLDGVGFYVDNGAAVTVSPDGGTITGYINMMSYRDELQKEDEFLPASKRYINDYVQYVKSDFLAGLGFGATQQLGETTGCLLYTSQNSMK